MSDASEPASSSSAPRAIDALMEVIEQRYRERPEGSYTTRLFAGGVPKIGEKVLEEAREVVEAADESGPEGRAHFIYEVADLLYHTCVLMGFREISWSEVEQELGRRFGVSGLAEKAARSKPASD